MTEAWNRLYAHGDILALTQDPKGNIYLGGDFDYVGYSTGAGGLLETASGAVDLDFPTIEAIAVEASAPDGAGGLYIGGYIYKVGDEIQDELAHILPDGSVDQSWPGASSMVRALAVSTETVYLGGWFDSVGGQVRNNLAAIDSSGVVTPWYADGSDLGGQVDALAVFGDKLYVGGDFDRIDGKDIRALAAIAMDTSGTVLDWNPIDQGVWVHALAATTETLYIGGAFSSVLGQSRAGLAAIDTSQNVTSWSPIVQGGDVTDIAVHGNTVYLAGSFTGVNGSERTGLAAVDTTGNLLPWNPQLGHDYDIPNDGPVVVSLAVGSDKIYAGGRFDSVNGQKRQNMAAFDIASGSLSTWDAGAVGYDGLEDAYVSTLTIVGQKVFVGGWTLGSVGTRPRDRLASLDTSGQVTSWNPSASGTVRSLIAANDQIYAGGDFTAVGGQPRDRLASLDTSGQVTPWNPSASGTVRSLIAANDQIYAGGDFTAVGGQPRDRLASLDTSGQVTAWNPSANASVHSLIAANDQIYAGGDFTAVGGQPRDRLASLDTSGQVTSWNPSASGTVRSLIAANDQIYAGGDFTTVGGQPRDRLASLDTFGQVTAWNPSANASVRSLVPFRDMIVIGGAFSTINGAGRPGLAAVAADGAFLSPWAPANASDLVLVNCLLASDNFTVAGGFIRNPDTFDFKLTGFELEAYSPINPDIFSTSHLPGSWSRDKTVDIELRDATDADSGVHGYSITWSQDATEVPTAAVTLEALASGVDTASSPALVGGAWYINLRTRDQFGNWSDSVHEGPFLIDTSAPIDPTLSSLGHTPGTWSNDSTVDLTIHSDATDTGSGVAGFSFSWTPGATETPDTTIDIATIDFERATIAAGLHHTVGLKDDGTVVAVGDNHDGQTNVSSWTGIKDVAAGQHHTVGLKDDGTVVAVGRNVDGATNVSSWTGIKAVAAGGYHTIGLKQDGTVVAAGSTVYGMTDVSSWGGIISIAAGARHTVGLKEDGTVVAVGQDFGGKTDVSSWTNIKAIAGGYHHTVGLKEDGTVLTVGSDSLGSINVSSWTGITAIAAGTQHTLGLKSDGTVVAVGSDPQGAQNISSWSGITAIAAGWYHTVGQESDGTALAVGYGDQGQTNVSSWSDIRQPTYMTTRAVLLDGLSYFNLRTVDNVGNWTSGVHIGPFGVDTSVPTNVTLSSQSHTLGSWSFDVTATIELSGATDTASGVVGYSVSWSQNSTETPPQVMNLADSGSTTTTTGTVLGDGIWHANVSTKDNAGNWTSTAHIGPFMIDTALPIDPTLSSPGHTPGTWSNDGTVDLTIHPDATDTGSGIAGFSFSWTPGATDTPDQVVDIVSSGDTTEATTSPPLADGLWYANVSTVDNVGNWTTTVHKGPFKIDTTGPVASLKINGGALVTKSSRVTLNISAEDNLSGLYWMRARNKDSKWSSWEPFKTTKEWNLLEASAATVENNGDGLKEVEFEVKDKAYNHSEIVLDTIKLDTQEPITKMVTPFVSTKISKTTTFKVKWMVEDPEPSSGLETVRVYYRPSGSSTWRLWKTASSSNGDAYFTGRTGVTYYFKTLAIDEARNWDWSKVYKTIVPFNEGQSLYKRIGFFGYKKDLSSQNYLSSVRYSYKRDHALIYKLYNTNGIGLVVTKGPNIGRAKIYVDGKYVTTVDAYKSSKKARQLIFYKGFAKKGTHWLKVVNLGTPGRAKFEVDGVVVGR